MWAAVHGQGKWRYEKHSMEILCKCSTQLWWSPVKSLSVACCMFVLQLIKAVLIRNITCPPYLPLASRASFLLDNKELAEWKKWRSLWLHKLPFLVNSRSVQGHSACVKGTLVTHSFLEYIPEHMLKGLHLVCEHACMFCPPSEKQRNHAIEQPVHRRDGPELCPHECQLPIAPSLGQYARAGARSQLRPHDPEHHGVILPGKAGPPTRPHGLPLQS